MPADPEYKKYGEQINKFIYDPAYSKELKDAQSKIKRVIRSASTGPADLQSLIDAMWEYQRMLQKNGYILDDRVLQTHFTMPYWDGDVDTIRQVYRDKVANDAVWWQ